MFGLFQEWGQTSNGGPKLKIAGKWVFPSRKCVLDGLNPGMQVEYETTQGGNDGKLTILQRIRPAPAGSPQGSQGSPQTGSTITDGDILRSVSNVIGNACAAGTIKTAAEMGAWFVGAYMGFKYMAVWAERDSGSAQASGTGGNTPGPAPREPGWDDDQGDPGFDDSDKLRF